ncbi:ADP-ribosylglycohydrolase family protein [Pseudonocardia nigra]|uniref:ADP-ribosylglycohydrolase family protein n=1 Tax=Pseudonocardia nigra TaxID=1921578 RepID=UPI001FEAA021|nr:ADP-ribosylglycohydrolase family protein [Pseudonocardia nigra]
MRATGWAALDPAEVRDRIRGAILGGACGDGLGAPFVGQDVVAAERFEGHRHGMRLLTHTDDTVLTLVLAQHLSHPAGGRGDLHEDRLAREFAWAWRREPWRAHGTGEQQVFRSVLFGIPWRRAAAELVGDTGSNGIGNGGAARVAPVGLLGRSLDAVLGVARRSAQLTHPHPLGQGGAALQAAAVALAASSDRDRPFDREVFLDAVLACPAHPAFVPRLHRMRQLEGESLAAVVGEFSNAVSALESVPAAILAFLHSPDDPEQVLDLAVRFGGDTSSVAAMAGTLVGARCGASQLPSDLVPRIEDGPRVVDIADGLARRAVMFAPVPAA